MNSIKLFLLLVFAFSFIINTVNAEPNPDNNPRVNLEIKEWYPKEKHYVFVCDNNFQADHFDWYYGDGEKQIDIRNQDTYHIYKEPGTYQVKCVAKKNNIELEDSITINILDTINEPEQVNNIKHKKSSHICDIMKRTCSFRIIEGSKYKFRVYDSVWQVSYLEANNDWLVFYKDEKYKGLKELDSVWIINNHSINITSKYLDGDIIKVKFKGVDN